MKKTGVIVSLIGGILGKGTASFTSLADGLVTGLEGSSLFLGKTAFLKFTKLLSTTSKLNKDHSYVCSLSTFSSFNLVFFSIE